MAKIQDLDFKKESLNQREFNDDVIRLWNNSLYEMKVISSSQPNWVEDVSGIPVYSSFGANGRLYISDIGTDNKWVYVDMTAL